MRNLKKWKVSKKILTAILTASMILGSASMAYGEEEGSSSYQAGAQTEGRADAGGQDQTGEETGGDEAAADSSTEVDSSRSGESSSTEDTSDSSKGTATESATESTTESVGESVSEADTESSEDPSTTGTVATETTSSMDGDHVTDTIYAMDADGNLKEVTLEGDGVIREDQGGQEESEEDDSLARASVSNPKIVNFRATKSGTAVTGVTTYKEYQTNADGYTYGGVGADAAYLGTSGGKVKFMQAGVVGLVDESKVQVVSLSSVKGYSYYETDGSNLYHCISNNLASSNPYSELNVGQKPSYLSANATYYSYDGHYFYTNYATMLYDYERDTRSQSVNAGQPYYNYFQYLSMRSTSNYSAGELTNMINTLLNKYGYGSSSVLYGTGSSFVKYQNAYGVNALLTAAAAINESGWGTSNYAKNRYNLFGINAVDSDPDQATYFSSADACIKDFTETYMSKRYMRPGYTYYHGSCVGDKASGVNVSWGSSPYWGEVVASIARSLDATGGNKDYGNYTIGIKDTISSSHNNVNVRKDASTSSTVLYTTGSHSNYPVIIRKSSGDFYEIQSDGVLNSGRTGVVDSTGNYNVNNMYAYIAKSYVTTVFTGSKSTEASVGVDYSVHAQTYGWMDTVSDGASAGTSGESKRLEAIAISLRNSSVSGSIQYRVHRQTYGWEDDWKSDGAVSGTTGEGKRLEAIQIKLTGQMAQKYDVYYRVHAQSYGWLGWAKNGESAGTSGMAKRLEAIEIRLVAKGGEAPGDTSNSFVKASIKYQTHVQSYGWRGWSFNNLQSGTTGLGKRLEAIQIQLVDPEVSGSVQYRTHVQTYGWQDWVSDGAVSGTSGQAKRLEAIQIQLTGEMADKYDIYYRVHSQTYGWLDWAKNGEYAGTSGLAKRLESIEIRLVEKGASAPGSTDRPYVGN